MKRNAQLIMELVTASHEHLTAEQIHMALQNSGNSMARSSGLPRLRKTCRYLF